MVQRKYIVNRLQTSASAMLSSTKVQLTAGGLLILALALLSTLVYLFYLKEPTSVGSEFSSSSKLNSNQQQQIAHYRQQFVRNLTAELWWRRHELENRQNRQNNNNKSSAGLADLRLTFAALTTLKVMQLDNQFAAAKQTIVSALLKSDSVDLVLRPRPRQPPSTGGNLQPVDLVNEYLASLLSASALEEEEDEDGDGKQELLQVATSRLVPLVEQHYQWGDGFVSYESDLPPPPSHQLLLSPQILAHYPVFHYLANVTATRAYRQLVNAFEDVFNYILIGRSVQNQNSNQSDGEYQSPAALQGLLLPLPVNLARKTFESKEFEVFKSRKQEADVGQLAASLLAVHLQAPNTSLQVGRLERLFDFITLNLTKEWKPHSPYVKSFFDFTQEKGEKTDLPPSMHYSQCNLGSTLALGARALEEHLQALTSMDEKMRAEEVERYRKMAALGASLVDTCHRAAETEVNFGSSDQFYLLPNGSIIHSFSEEDEHFDFSHHQLAEAYFVLHRLTGDPAYREYAWQMTEALHRKLLLSSKTSSSSSSKSNQLLPQLFSATLKYLYLVQSGDYQLPLERWLFSQPAGHPLPVLGSIEWADDGDGGYEEDDGDNGGDRLVVGASFYRPRGGGGGGRNHRNQGATTIIISESPDLN